MSLKQALADLDAGDHPDVAGGLPLPRITPTTADLRVGVAILEQQLQPVGREHAAFCIAKLITGFNDRLTKDEAKLRVEVWLEACGDLPADLWSKATVELLRTWKRDDHFGRTPEPSDFRATVDDLAKRRATDLQRARAMLAKANEPDQAKPAGPIAVPNKVRLKRILEEQREAPYPDEAMRTHDMAHTERALAFEERRPMVAWAHAWFDERVPKNAVAHTANVLAQRSSATSKRLAELAAESRKPAPNDIPVL